MQELGIEEKAPKAPESSQTIAWWQQRQSEMERRTGQKSGVSGAWWVVWGGGVRGHDGVCTMAWGGEDSNSNIACATLCIVEWHCGLITRFRFPALLQMNGAEGAKGAAAANGNGKKKAAEEEKEEKGSGKLKIPVLLGVGKKAGSGGQQAGQAAKPSKGKAAPASDDDDDKPKFNLRGLFSKK